jgi:hypothetical protein
MKTMHAGFVGQFGKPLVLRDCEVPSPGAGQILGDVASRVVLDFVKQKPKAPKHLEEGELVSTL